jgi:hypothetical protein
MKLIVCGLPRSGTTILTNFINSLPDAFVFSEPHWEYKKLRGTSFFLPELSSLCLEYKNDDVLPLESALTEMEKKFQIVGFKETYRSNIVKSQDAEAPNHELLFRYKQRGYKFVYIARNPIEILNSSRNTFGGNNDYWPRNMAITIHSYVDFFNFVSKEPIVNYDKFISSPELEFSKKTGIKTPPKVKLCSNRVFALGDSRGYSTKIFKQPCNKILSDSEIDVITNSTAMKLWRDINE